MHATGCIHSRALAGATRPQPHTLGCSLRPSAATAGRIPSNTLSLSSVRAQGASWQTSHDTPGAEAMSPIGLLGLGGVTRNKTHASASERMAKHALERYAPQKYKLNK